VWPSDAITGSRITESVIGHSQSLGRGAGAGAEIEADILLFLKSAILSLATPLQIFSGMDKFEFQSLSRSIND